MATLSRRRRRRSARSTPVSYGQNSYRAVRAAVKPPTIKTRTTQRRRLIGAAGWTADQRRALQRLTRLRRKALSSRNAKRKAVRSISLTERLSPRLRGTGGPCIKRPNSRLAGEASARRSGKGPAQTKEQRLLSFRRWC